MPSMEGVLDRWMYRRSRGARFPLTHTAPTPNHDGVSTARREWHADGEVERGGPCGEVEG